MRFDRLNLARYGAFSGRELVFRPDARLHIVFGPNEAGKSVLRAAISDLLFGFPKSKQQDFMHEASTLRVGATLRAKDDNTLSFRRRRGNKNTVLTDDDQETALREDALTPCLGSLSREVFERAFGLDSARLREGANEMLSSDGELGSVLFSVASGLVGLSALRADLEHEAEKIFAPRPAKDRLFYQILSHHEEARKTERDSELRATDWKALLASIEGLKAEMADRRDRRIATRTMLAGLQRLLRLQPLIAEIDGEDAALTGFADIAGVAEGLADDLLAGLAEATEAAKAVQAAERHFTEAQDTLNRIQVEAPLLENAEAIQALFGRSGDYVSKKRDLPRIVGERDDYEGQIGERMRRLGLSGGPEIERRQPPDATLVHLRNLIAEGHQLASAIATHQRRITEEQEGLAAIERGQSVVALIDPKPWRERHAALAPDLRAVSRHGELAARHRSEQRKMQEQAARLDPVVDDLDRLASVSLPSADVIAARRDKLDGLDRTIASAHDRLAENASETGRLTGEIVRFERDGKAPTRALITDARDKRDGRLVTLRDAFAGVEPALAATEVVERLDHLHLLSAEADRLADSALADAESVAHHVVNVGRRSELEATKAKLEAERVTLETQREAAHRDYRSLFERAGVEPGPPMAMIGWVDAVAGLLEQRQSLEQLGGQIVVLEGLTAQLEPALTEIADGIGLHAGTALSISAFERLIADRLQDLSDVWAESRASAGKREEAMLRIGKLEKDLRLTMTQQENWTPRFVAALRQLNLPSDFTGEQAAATLELWERLPAIIRERDNRAGRVTGMKRDIEAFEAEVGATVVKLAPELVGLPAETAAQRLQKKADVARATESRRQAAAQVLDKCESQCMAARELAEAATTALAVLTASLPAHADTKALAARLVARDQLRAALASLRVRFATQSDGQGEATIRAALDGFDCERATVEVEELAQEETALIDQMSARAGALAEKERERDQLEAGAGAEHAAFQKQAAEVEIVEAARQWAVLKLASTMLGQAMEKHRESQSDPLMRRAGALFSTLTGGSFTTLAQDYGDDDRPRLLSVRASGERVAIEGLSEGTCDQLYLALRLAFIEDYASRNEPVPFIGDDIFQTFDDERAAAGIRALAAMNEYCQPILFTHHKSVVTIANEVLSGDVDILEL
jgi:chromosome segregation protein